MKFYILCFLISYLSSELVNGEAELYRHNEEDELQLLLDGKRVMPDQSCRTDMGYSQEHAQSACYLHCILTGFGAGTCSEDTQKCDCYGEGPPAYYSASYASKIDSSIKKNVEVDRSEQKNNFYSDLTQIAPQEYRLQPDETVVVFEDRDENHESKKLFYASSTTEETIATEDNMHFETNTSY